MANFGTVTSDTTLDRFFYSPARRLRKGATAPTDATVGTTPTIGVLRFDAVGELGSLVIGLPPDMDKTVNPQLVLLNSLVSAETNNDVLAWTMDYTAIVPNSTGKGIAKTSTGLTATTTLTTANGLAVGDIYETTFTITAADATNPLTSAAAIACEVHLTNVTTVAAIHLVGLTFKYRGKY